MMLSNNSSVSRWNDCRKLSSKSRNSSELGSTDRTLRRCSHCPAKLLIGAAGQGRNDLLRAERFCAGGGRAAGEDAAPTGRVAGTAGIERAGDGERLDVRLSGPVEVVCGTAEKRLEPHRVLDRQVL